MNGTQTTQSALLPSEVLYDNKIEGRHVIRISGHKNTNSIKSYARRLISNHVWKPNFRFLPDSLATDDNLPTMPTSLENNRPVSLLNQLYQTAHFKVKPVSSQNIATCTSKNATTSLLGEKLFDGEEDFFAIIPNNLLIDKNSNVTPMSAFRPIFNNRTNCTINLNIHCK